MAGFAADPGDASRAVIDGIDNGAGVEGVGRVEGAPSGGASAPAGGVGVAVEEAALEDVRRRARR